MRARGPGVSAAPPSTSAPLLSLPGRTPALRDVSFAVARETRRARGANGAGKSTLLLTSWASCRSACRGSGGDVGGIPLTATRAAGPRRGGLLFEDPDDMLFCATVREDAASGRAAGIRSRSAPRAWTGLAAVGLAALADRRRTISPRARSAGRASRPPGDGAALLLLDDPTRASTRAAGGTSPPARRLPAAMLIAATTSTSCSGSARGARARRRSAGGGGPAEAVLADEPLMLATASNAAGGRFSGPSGPR